jgi:hypothetical protein
MNKNGGNVIGTYDPRAIGIAFGNSTECTEFVADCKAQMTQAKAAKNDSLIRQIEKKGEAFQVLAHLRGFSVGSVADILEKHKAEVESVAREAGVRAIVSKFELIHTGTGADVVDVTLPLARIFKPSEQVLRSISQLRDQPPLPMLDALLIPAEE